MGGAGAGAQDARLWKVPLWKPRLGMCDRCPLQGGEGRTASIELGPSGPGGRRADLEPAPSPGQAGQRGPG